MLFLCGIVVHLWGVGFYYPTIDGTRCARVCVHEEIVGWQLSTLTLSQGLEEIQGVVAIGCNSGQNLGILFCALIFLVVRLTLFTRNVTLFFLLLLVFLF